MMPGRRRPGAPRVRCGAWRCAPSAPHCLADRAPGREELASAATAALTAVTSLGGAEVGDKTLVDALAPFATAFATRLRTEDPVAEAYASAVALARTAAEDTAGLRPRLGRARPLADRSVGTPIPGPPHSPPY